MTELLERAIRAARDLPPDVQDDVARLVLSFAGFEEVDGGLTEGDEAAVSRSREAAARGEFASDEAVTALWAKHGQ